MKKLWHSLPPFLVRISVLVFLGVYAGFCSARVYFVAPLIHTAKAAVIAPQTPLNAPNSLVTYSQREIDQLIAGAANKDVLRTLIKCESQNTNIARMDSNNLMSYGILQFNGTSTWAEFAPLAGVSSSPMIPQDAIKVADWMISHGHLARWSCAYITGLLKN